MIIYHVMSGVVICLVTLIDSDSKLQLHFSQTPTGECKDCLITSCDIVCWSCLHPVSLSVWVQSW